MYVEPDVFKLIEAIYHLSYFCLFQANWIDSLVFNHLFCIFHALLLTQQQQQKVHYFHTVTRTKDK